MSWLRPILLLAGAIFIAVLVWWERRQPHRVRKVDGVPATRADPVPVPAPEPGPERAMTGSATRAAKATSEERGGSERELRRTPPVIDWSDVVPRPEHVIPPVAPSTQAAELGPASAVAAAPARVPTGEAELPLRVEWPDEGERRIVTLRILPSRHDRLAGRALRQGLTASGFRHGAFGIFHMPEPDGRVLISAASLVRPGMLDPATMDFQRFAGINLFVVLPGPLSDEQALQRLGQVAVELAARVEGQVQEESGAPFDTAAVSAWRGRCLAAIYGGGAGAGPVH
jgi:FtsZ-interacting cell division protein ZipA